MDTLPLLVIVYLVGLLCAIVIHAAGRAFRGGTIPSPLSALARASVWPLGLLMALAGIVAGMPIILGTRIGQGMRQGMLAHAAEREPARPTKIPVYPFPQPTGKNDGGDLVQINSFGKRVEQPPKSPSAPSSTWPTGAARPKPVESETGGANPTSPNSASRTSEPKTTEPTKSASSESATTAAQSPDTPSASA